MLFFSSSCLTTGNPALLQHPQPVLCASHQGPLTPTPNEYSQCTYHAHLQGWENLETHRSFTVASEYSALNLAKSKSPLNTHLLECFKMALGTGTHTLLSMGPLSFGSEVKEALAVPELTTNCCHFTNCSPQHGGESAGPLSSAVCLLGR